MRLSMTTLVVATIVAATWLPGPAVARSRSHHPPKVAPVSQGFVGVDVDGPMVNPTAGVNEAHQFGLMVTNGVQSVRVAFNWAEAQPYPSWADVPAAEQSQFTDVGGEPMNFTATDAMVGLAAQRGLTVLPTVLYAPSWDAKDNPGGVDTPTRTAPYANYMTALVHRYGPHGTYWSTHPGLSAVPIRMWQIWNEPNLSYYWHQPFATGYVALLRAAHTAITRADSGAKVVLGALTNLAWTAVGQIDHVQGARGLYDIAAVNGFTKRPSDVIRYLRLMRNAMVSLGDGSKPLLATEMSWPSAQGKTPQSYDFDTTEAGQARNIAALLPMLGADRSQLHLAGFYYYTWVGAESSGGPAFSFAGLLRAHNGSVVAKPALSAFRTAALALEQCKQKGSVATRCAKPATP